MSRSSFSRVIAYFFLLSMVLSTSVGGQGLQQTPYSPADTVRRGPAVGGGFGITPYNPLGLSDRSVGISGRTDSLYISDCMFRGILPLIPNLQFGYLYNFGNNRVSSSRFTADYLLPLTLSPNSMIFGEAHTEFQDFWKTDSFNSRVDLSFGGGYRGFLTRDTFLGVNGFYDTSRLGSNWYSSGGLGLEMAALVGTSDALDLNFNWYGQLFNSNVIRNALRYGPSNFDVQAGYSHELWSGGPDIRLKMTGYKFDIGNSVYGWNSGVELKSRDGVFVLKYDVGHDKVNETYQTVGGFVNVGFQLENLFKGENPFGAPEPIFRSPRSLRYMLTQPVKRDWHQPSAIIITRQGQAGQGGVCNTDRVLDNVVLVHDVTGFGTPTPAQFPAVPVACLQTGLGIVVEIDYTTVSANASSSLVVVVSGNVTFNGRSVIVPNGTNNTVSVPLTIPANRQDAFIAAGDDPIQIGLAFIDLSMGFATVQEVRIRFNRP